MSFFIFTHGDIRHKGVPRTMRFFRPSRRRRRRGGKWCRHEILYTVILQNLIVIIRVCVLLQLNANQLVDDDDIEMC